MKKALFKLDFYEDKKAPSKKTREDYFVGLSCGVTKNGAILTVSPEEKRHFPDAYGVT